MASNIDPTLDGTLDDLQASVSKPALKTALTAAKDEITGLQSGAVDGDTLLIDYVPSNYTRTTTPAEVTLETELTAHLAGLDAAVAGGGGGGGGGSGDMAEATYDPAGIAQQLVGLTATQTVTNKTISGATNTIAADRVTIAWTPSNYTRTTAPAESEAITDLTAHLAGIDAKIGVPGEGEGNVSTDDTSAIINRIVVSADTSGRKYTTSETSVGDLVSFTWLDNNTIPLASLGITNNERLIYADANGDLVGLELGNLTITSGVLNAPGGGSAGNWGDIGGTLSDQTDLNNALNGKVDDTSAIQGTGGVSVTGSWAADYTIQLASIAQGTVLGRGATAGAGVPAALNGAALRAIANVGDGADLVGPDGVVDEEIVVFDGVTGKLVKSGGTKLSDISVVATPSFFVDGAGPDLIAGAIRAPAGAILYVSTAVKEDFEANATSGELEEAEGWLILEDPTLGGGGGGSVLEAYYLGSAESEGAADPVATNLPISGGALPVGVSVEVDDTILITYGGRRSGSVGSPSALTGSDGVTVGSFSLVADQLHVGPANSSRASIATAVVTAVTSGGWTLTLDRDAADGWQQGMQVWLLKGGVTVVGTDEDEFAETPATTIAPEVATSGATNDLLFNAVSVISGGLAGTITAPAGITASPSVITLESNNGFRHASGYRDDSWNTAQSWTIPEDTGMSATSVAAIFRPAA